MSSLLHARWAGLAVLLASRAWDVAAQTTTSPPIVPTNATVSVNLTSEIGLYLSNGGGMPNSPFATILQLSSVDSLDASPLGLLYPTNTSSQFSVPKDSIAFISCDSQDYNGNIQLSNVYSEARQRNASAFLFYSRTSDRCQLNASAGDDYNRTYTVQNATAANELLGRLRDTPQLWASIRAENDPSPSQPSPTPSSNPAGEWGGPAPSTAVAMIILYSITGVITVLFLAIIVTGAIRAHRHPERYGPRTVSGQPRRSRARGLAQAMLESLPIVKVGDRQTPAKPEEVELESGSTVARNQTGTETTAAVADADGAAPTNTEAGISSATEISPAQNKIAADESSSLGCSICTEDFEVGQDQRVLPCDHRFHPACVDPWLLNVSGTCPLCRIDLRGEQEAEGHGEGDGTSQDMAPPLQEQSPVPEDRNSTRRSVMLAVMGLRRPDRMTREERIAALRAYRAQQVARTDGREGNATETSAASGEQEDESSVRNRLRRVLRIRTRRVTASETNSS